MASPSSGFVVRIQHLPDRTCRLWLEEPSGLVDLGSAPTVTGIYPVVHRRVAERVGVAPDRLGGVELVDSAPPWFVPQQAVSARQDDGRTLPGHVVGYLQGGLVVHTAEGIGIHAHEDLDTDPPADVST